MVVQLLLMWPHHLWSNQVYVGWCWSLPRNTLMIHKKRVNGIYVGSPTGYSNVHGQPTGRAGSIAKAWNVSWVSMRKINYVASKYSLSLVSLFHSSQDTHGDSQLRWNLLNRTSTYKRFVFGASFPPPTVYQKINVGVLLISGSEVWIGDIVHRRECKNTDIQEG